ncbi:S-protein homolog 1-like [Benincasa hispida]|uniref:S-protein homolog 1-like n=1 Tax=Benincasa hispida TaxID=102211 RepID=UPI001901B2A4|nr:S-protein homolog 1-like [Benincasa hispida]
MTAAAVGAEDSKVVIAPLPPSRYYIHIVNRLSYLGMLAHCQSKDDDLGYRHMLKNGDEFQWNFRENFWRTTLFWCCVERPDAYVSFEVFWPERRHRWLRDRCGSQGTCVWIAKDDGIYLRNMGTNTDEFVHKWIFKRCC